MLLTGSRQSINKGISLADQTGLHGEDSDSEAAAAKCREAAFCGQYKGYIVY